MSVDCIVFAACSFLSPRLERLQGTAGELEGAHRSILEMAEAAHRETQARLEEAQGRLRDQEGAHREAQARLRELEGQVRDLESGRARLREGFERSLEEAMRWGFGTNTSRWIQCMRATLASFKTPYVRCCIPK